VTEELQSLENDQWQGKSLIEFVQLEAGRLSALEECCQEQKAFGPFEVSINFSEHDRVQVEIRGTPHTDSDRDFAEYRGTISDITTRKVAESRALYLSNHDELTNLKNRRALNNDLPQIIARAQSTSKKVAYVGIDLDGFKAVNDSYGHAAGDNLLVAVSRRLEGTSKENSHVFRKGGDEFVMLIENLPATDFQSYVNLIADRALQSISQDFPSTEKDVNISASIGVAVFPDDAFHADEFARRADLAMYSAKFQGKSRLVWFDRQLDNEMDHRFKLEAELKRAIEQA